MPKRDFLAGALLVNTIPHAVMGIAGKRCLTPLGGEDSSARLNLAWAAMNLAGAAMALSSGGWRATTRAEADDRRVTMQSGMLAITLFGFGYELTAGRRKRIRMSSTG
ncbi:hypothetical protein [Amycolatopsis cihanbeyliensis]|uniref:Uncharacterized protein n=1 Tax=Amycolatopsis cihanbeyliensis TaxID=1128664 RepID=A0A542DEM0_AMYCI|nr:hypothetical protein [Amycolatopsis cihanbeyliensis]TQJ01509.1 hypothetical protein FB471_1194 [Amycolatopsis cihanbeyliensis]